MPVDTLAVNIAIVSVLDDADCWGSGEWHLHASVNGQTIGDSSTEFTARTGDCFLPPKEQWTEVVDVSGHTDGDQIEVRLRIVDEDVFSDDDLGEVRAVLNYPYTEPYRIIFLESPMLPGGWFSDDYRAYCTLIIVKHVDEVASTNATGADRIPVTRGSHGGATFNTVQGDTFLPRVDIHPVIPVPQAPSHVVRPVQIPSGLAAAVVPPASQVTTAPSVPTLNALPNPSVIARLSTSDPDLANRAANLAITAYEPGNLDTAKFFWRVASGPAVIVGGSTGLTIQARGTGTGTNDELAVFEVRWENATGPLLAIYRAWVGKLGTLKYRVNLLNGMVPSGSPSGTAAPYQTSTLMPPATADSIMQIVRAIWYQAGILLVPDDDTTCYEGARLTSAGNAVFQLTVTNNQHTNNVSHGIISSSTRYNFRPGVINIAVAFSCGGNRAAAVDRNGIAGSPDTGKHLADDYQYTYNGSGSESQLGGSGSPSTSWVKPAGVGRDAAGTQQTIKTIGPTDRVNQARKLDRDFVTARRAVDTSFTAAKMGELYAAQVPARWGNSLPSYSWHCGVNFAHELGHVLGLAHRGNAGHGTHASGASLDGINYTTAAGVTQGHPWLENIMTYGYGNINPPRALDVDLMQAAVARQHPGISYT